MDNKDHIDIHVMEESRTDQQGNEWYKKMEMVIRKNNHGTPSFKVPKPRAKMMIYLAICVFVCALIFIKPLLNNKEDITSAELNIMVKNAEKIKEPDISDFFKRSQR